MAGMIRRLQEQLCPTSTGNFYLNNAINLSAVEKRSASHTSLVLEMLG